MKLSITELSFLVILGTVNLSEAGSKGKEDVHFKINVPSFVDKIRHTKTVYVHSGGGHGKVKLGGGGDHKAPGVVSGYIIKHEHKHKHTPEPKHNGKHKHMKGEHDGVKHGDIANLNHYPGHDHGSGHSHKSRPLIRAKYREFVFSNQMDGDQAGLYDEDKAEHSPALGHYRSIPSHHGTPHTNPQFSLSPSYGGGAEYRRPSTISGQHHDHATKPTSDEAFYTGEQTEGKRGHFGGYPGDEGGSQPAQVNEGISGGFHVGNRAPSYEESSEGSAGGYDVGDHPSHEALTAHRPTYEALTAHRPSFEVPTHEALTANRPTYEALTAHRPTFEAPTHEALTAHRPTYEAPTHEALTAQFMPIMRPSNGGRGVLYGGRYLTKQGAHAGALPLSFNPHLVNGYALSNYVAGVPAKLNADSPFGVNLNTAQNQDYHIYETSESNARPHVGVGLSQNDNSEFDGSSYQSYHAQSSNQPQTQMYLYNNGEANERGFQHKVSRNKGR